MRTPACHLTPKTITSFQHPSSETQICCFSKKNKFVLICKGEKRLMLISVLDSIPLIASVLRVMGNFKVNVSSSQSLVTVRKPPARRTEHEAEPPFLGDSRRQESLIYSGGLISQVHNTIKFDLNKTVSRIQDSSENTITGVATVCQVELLAIQSRRCVICGCPRWDPHAHLC